MATPHTTGIEDAGLHDPGLLGDTGFWLLISFVIFAFILWRKGKTSFTSMLDKRIEAIKNDIQTAENLHVEAQQLLAQYQRKHRDAVKEAETIIANAEKHAHQIQVTAEKELSETMARREKQLSERLERMKQSAIEDIQSYAANLAIDATRAIILEKLDQKSSDKLVNESIKDLGSNFH